MVKQASCIMGLFFLLSLASPCRSQTGYPQRPAASDSDRMVYPQYNIFGMPSTTRPDRQVTPSRRVGLPPGVSDWQAGSQPASQPASRPATQPATNPASQ
jgi:hypothetical protein